MTVRAEQPERHHKNTGSDCLVPSLDVLMHVIAEELAERYLEEMETQTESEGKGNV